MVRSQATEAIVPRDYWPAIIGRCDPYREGVWYEAHEKMLTNEKKGEDRQEYVSGFHVWVNRVDAGSCVGVWDDVVLEVEYDGAHTLGDGQEGFPGRQVIAKRMRILFESERT
jgi:hypothetical protein